MPVHLCVACSASLYERDHTTISLDDDSEKVLQPLFLTCGVHAVCGQCVRRNSRLADYCLSCEDVGELVGGPRKIKRQPIATALPSYQEDGDKVEESLPTYNSATTSSASSPSFAARGEEKRGAQTTSIHYLASDDSLSGLALRYRIDGTLLARLNHLPSSTLSTTPHLLHTLPFLLLPPGTRSASAVPLLSPYEEHQRLTIRRFAVSTRCSDYATCKIYVDRIFQARQARFAEGREEGADIRVGGELEEAVEQYTLDNEWEQSQKGKGSAMHGHKFGAIASKTWGFGR